MTFLINVLTYGNCFKMVHGFGLHQKIRIHVCASTWTITVEQIAVVRHRRK